jgi:hypothetical protein
MGYAIIKGQYFDAEKKTASVTVKNEETGAEFDYNVVEGDPAPLNQELLELLREEDGAVRKYLGNLDDRTPSERVLMVREDQLRTLDSKPYLKKRREDPQFDMLVLQSIDEWNEIEKQPGFPYDIEWPEIWPDIPPETPE